MWPVESRRMSRPLAVLVLVWTVTTLGVVANPSAELALGETTDYCAPGRKNVTSGYCICDNGCVLPRCLCWSRDCGHGSSTSPLTSCVCDEGWSKDESGSCTKTVRFDFSATAIGAPQVASNPAAVTLPPPNDVAERTVRLIIALEMALFFGLAVSAVRV